MMTAEVVVDGDGDGGGGYDVRSNIYGNGAQR